MIHNVIITIIVIIVLVLFLYSLIFNFYQKKYYEQAYKSKVIKSNKISKYPEKFIINGINNVSSEKQYQEAAALKMINDLVYEEEKLSINNINFFMGYTYGTSFNLLSKSFIPFSEPIEGARIAAPFMGFNMDYYTTYSVKLFFNAAKYYISCGYPVLVQLNMTTLYNKKGFYPHSELLVGYNKNGFYYYETIGKENKDKKYVENQKFISAVYKLNATFKKPWRYGFSLFTVKEKNKQINDLLKKNGISLIGEKKDQITSGAQALVEFAKYIKESKTFNSEWVLEALAYSRSDNAAFFEEFFKDNSNLKEIANLFKVVSKNYNKALKIIRTNINEKNINEVSAILLENSQLEEQIGKLLKNSSSEATFVREQCI